MAVVDFRGTPLGWSYRAVMRLRREPGCEVDWAKLPCFWKGELSPQGRELWQKEAG